MNLDESLNKSRVGRLWHNLQRSSGEQFLLENHSNFYLPIVNFFPHANPCDFRYYVPYYMKFWRHFNLAILKKSLFSGSLILAIFRTFWNLSHLIFAISRAETLAN